MQIDFFDESTPLVFWQVPALQMMVVSESEEL